MKKVLVISIVCALLSGSCSKTSSTGELTGVEDRKAYFEPDPYGMVFIPQGSYNMGPNDQDVAWAQNVATKQYQLMLSGWMKQKSQIMNIVNLCIGFAIPL